MTDKPMTAEEVASMFLAWVPDFDLADSPLDKDQADELALKTLTEDITRYGEQCRRDAFDAGFDIGELDERSRDEAYADYIRSLKEGT